MTIASLRKNAAYIALCLLAAAAIPLFFSARWFGPFQPVNVYQGPLGFSGDRALRDLTALAQEYPGRVSGSRTDRLSAQWVQKQFQSMGLDAQIEEFPCLAREQAVRPDKVSSVPASFLTFTATGYNVVATSPGKSKEAVVLGAHRDVSGSQQGAEDNASGTASLLELARVLSSTEHQYTYIFVSYDGEEQGLRGSEAFARSHEDLGIKLAVSLDMTGFREATTVGFYPFVSRQSASPLWTVSLARGLSGSESLPVYQFGATDEASRSPAVTFWRVRKERLTSRVPTDTEPFVNRGVPSFGVIAIAMAGEKGVYAPIHGPIDDTEQVSATTLQMTGRFVERYVKSLGLNRFTGEQNSRLYFVSGDTVLSPASLTGFAAYSGILVAGALVLAWRDSAGQYGLRSFAGFLKADWAWACLTLACAALSALFPLLVKTSLARRFTIVTFNALWGALTLAGVCLVAFLRQRALNKRDLSYHEMTANQKMLVNVWFGLSFAAIFLLANPFAAIDFALFPILFLGRVNFRSQDSRALWSIATVVWVACCIFGMRARISGAAFNPLTLKALVADFFRLASWMLTVVYIFTAPRRGALIEDKARVA